MEQLANANNDIISSLILNGDLSKMTPEQKIGYYKNFCESLGLNPLTQPFQILVLNNKHKLYATKDATDQLRKIHNVSIIKLEKSIESGLCIFTAYAKSNGKEDASSGAVTIDGLKGEALANAIMKAETKAKRRVTLSICGLGLLDENEVTDIPQAQTITVENIQPKIEAKTEEELSIDDLHKEFLPLLATYRMIVGEAKAAVYDPDNWKTERTAKSYGYAINTIKEMIAKAQPVNA